MVADTGLATKKELFNNALTLLQWAVRASTWPFACGSPK